MSRKLVLASVLLFVAVSFDVGAICRNNCIQPPDGWIYCQSDCQYPATCKFNSQISCDSYCYLDYVVNACHNGSGETCCKSGPGGF